MTTKAEQRPPHNPSIRCGSSPCRLPRGRLGLWGQGSSLSPKPQVHFLFSEHPSSEILCQTQLTKGQDLLSQKHLHLKCPRLSWRRRQWPPLQYSCLENPMDGGAWWAAVHGVARSRTRLSDFTFTFMHWRRKWQPTPVFLPGEYQGWGSLVGCHLWGRTESDTTELLHFHFSLSCIGEGNGNPLQCSCLENPRDRGACWAGVYGVTQSRTRLKRCSSRSSRLSWWSSG